MTDHVETTLPCLIFAATIPGDVEALGRLVIDNDVAFDQAWVTYGIETDEHYTHTSSGGSGGLFYEAESRTAMGGSATAAGPSGASGAGSNVMRNTVLPTGYLAILSTQASGGGAHLTHKGTFRVYARVQVASANAGNVTLALSWSVGDFRSPTTNPPVTITEAQYVDNAQWRTVDLGLVTIPTSASQWEGRLLAKSTVSGDDIDVDYLFLVPADYASGVVSSVTPLESPTAFSARDEFDQAAGSLATKVMPIGGTWAGAGDADDFTINTTSHTAQRTAVSDSAGFPNSGRMALAGSTNYTNISVQVDATYTTGTPAWGVFARYVNLTNWLAAEVITGTTNSFLQLSMMVGASYSLLDSIVFPGNQTLHPVGTTATLRLQSDDQGRTYVWFNGRRLITVQHFEMATGALATGRVGFFDWNFVATASTRNYDNFMAAVPTKDAAAFASQSIEVRHDGVRRENSAGAFWVDKTITGDLLRVPPSGAEARSLRTIVKFSRHDPKIMPDPAVDDLSARLFVTPRYLT